MANCKLLRVLPLEQSAALVLCVYAAGCFSFAPMLRAKPTAAARETKQGAQGDILWSTGAIQWALCTPDYDSVNGPFPTPSTNSSEIADGNQLQRRRSGAASVQHCAPLDSATAIVAPPGIHSLVHIDLAPHPQDPQFPSSSTATASDMPESRTFLLTGLGLIAVGLGTRRRSRE